jgi:hypothetical protein
VLFKLLGLFDELFKLFSLFVAVYNFSLNF